MDKVLVMEASRVSIRHNHKADIMGNSSLMDSHPIHLKELLLESTLIRCQPVILQEIMTATSSKINKVNKVNKVNMANNRLVHLLDSILDNSKDLMDDSIEI